MSRRSTVRHRPADFRARCAGRGERPLRGPRAALLVGLFALAPAAAPAAAQDATVGCRDPWMTRAVREVAGRAPRGGGDRGECDLRLYGARWGSYEELRDQVATAFHALRAAGLEHDADGAVIRDRDDDRSVPVDSVYLGPRRRVPERRITVPLARDHVLAFDWPAAAGRLPLPPDPHGRHHHPNEEQPR